MNMNRNGVSSAIIGMAVVLVVVIIAFGAYVAMNSGTATTVTKTTTNTVVTTATTATTATSATFYPLTLQAGGSTFVNPAMLVWLPSFNLYTNGQVSVNYQAIGSGAGITGILRKTFEFAGSDAPVPLSQSSNYTQANGPLLQFPETLGGVAIFYNIPGVSISLNLTGSIIAKIYIGTITKWNDSAITSLNQGCSYYGHVGSLHSTCTLPSNTIVPVHRSDGSGTTYALSNYFSKVDGAEWNATQASPHYGTSINWPNFEIAAKGSGGVASYVQQNPNTIGYADSYYAFTNGLKAAAVQNQAGQFLVPSLTNIAAAANAFSAQVQANPTFCITDAPGAGSYPIATFTYLIVWQNQTNQQAGYDTAQLFWWIVHQGQVYGPNLNYSALPSNVVSIDETIIQQIQYNGVPFISG